MCEIHQLLGETRLAYHFIMLAVPATLFNLEQDVGCLRWLLISGSLAV